MKGSRLTTMGLYNYDNTLFDGLTAPEGMDKDLIVKNILIETADMELLYPDLEDMKTLIKIWADSELPIWQRLYDASQMEYNPIENYDRLEHEETQATGNTTNSGTDTQTTQVSAYDTDEFSNRERGTMQHGQKVDTSGEGTRDSRIHGNIGVTTSQQMLQSELDVRPKLNIVKYIATSYKHNFCILVY